VRAGTHFLVADSPPDAFKPTGDFDQNTKPVELKFEKPGLVKYHCERHRNTMIGTINVK
jgi:plastocyanin